MTILTNDLLRSRLNLDQTPRQSRQQDWLVTVLIFLGLYICLLWTDKHLGGEFRDHHSQYEIGKRHETGGDKETNIIHETEFQGSDLSAQEGGHPVGERTGSNAVFLAMAQENRVPRNVPYGHQNQRTEDMPCILATHRNQLP